VNADRFTNLCERILADAKDAGAGIALDAPVLVEEARRMRLMLLTISVSRPLSRTGYWEPADKYIERLKAIAAAGIDR